MKSRFTTKIIAISVLPVILLCLYLSISGLVKDRKEYYSDIQSELKNTAQAVSETYRSRYLDWAYIDSWEKSQYYDYSFINIISRLTSCEVTIFAGDTRIATTIVDSTGISQVGTKASDEVIDRVIGQGLDYLVSDITIAKRNYYGYYLPMTNNQGQVVAMIFTGKYYSEVQEQLFRSILSGLVKLLGLAMFLGVIAFFFAKKIVDDMDEIMKYMAAIAKGDFNQKMSESVLKRQDEFGELGQYSVRLSEEIQNLIQKDPLTGLYNRRACTSKLGKLISKANTEDQEKEPLSIAMVDIDYFKRVNDTYGHSMGDTVLKDVSAIIQKNVSEIGFAARWGGEEFLMVAQVDIDQMYKIIQMMCDEISSKEFNANYTRFHVTVTVGISQYRAPERMDNVINIADRRLYQGKEAGRNRIVTETK